MKQEINVSARENLKSAYEKYYASLYNFCFLRLKNEEQASDCVQDSFCVFYDRLLRGEEILNPGGYLYKTANNLVKAQFRQNKKEQGFLQLDAIENIAGKESVADFSGIDYDALAEKVLSALDEKEQEIYRLKYVNEKTIDEISAEMDISFSAAAKRLSRMRAKIKELITSELEGGE